MDKQLALFQIQLESLINSSDSIYAKTKQTRFNRVVLLEDLGMMRATAKVKSKILSFCECSGIKAVYSDVSKGFHFTLDVFTVRRSMTTSFRHGAMQ